MYIRSKDKIEVYIESQIKKNGIGTVVPGTQSRYYYINDKVLRVSDHIGSKSSGSVSIIIPSYKDNNSQYIIHGHNSGQISILDYEKAKELIRSFFCLSSIFGEVAVNREDVNKNNDEQKNEIKKFNDALERIKALEEYKELASNKTKTILGVPINFFTDGQLKAIVATVEKIKKEKGL